MIYLDNSATTSLELEVRDAMLPYYDSHYGNASSIYRIGREARIALENARAQVAEGIGADESEIVFTSGGTEANNHAVLGTVFARRSEGIALDKQSIITSNAEHHAVLEPIDFVSSLGVKSIIQEVDEDCIVRSDSLRSKLNADVTLVSLMSVNNETGALNQIRDITQLVKEHSPAYIHTDAVQALGKIDMNVKEWGVDLLTLSAHKIHGPKGVGALFIRRTVMIEPFLHGGKQERNRRGGTESVALAVGFAKAVELLAKEKEERKKHIRGLHSHLLSSLNTLDDVVINSPLGSKSVPEIVNITFSEKVRQKLEADTLIMRFDLDGIAVSNGSACTSGSLQPSHVLLAMGKGDDVAAKSIRISLSKFTTLSDIDTFISSLVKITTL